jgi:hypothetical protein
MKKQSIRVNTVTLTTAMLALALVLTFVSCDNDTIKSGGTIGGGTPSGGGGTPGGGGGAPDASGGAPDASGNTPDVDSGAPGVGGGTIGGIPDVAGDISLYSPSRYIPGVPPGEDATTGYVQFSVISQFLSNLGFDGFTLTIDGTNAYIIAVHVQLTYSPYAGNVSLHFSSPAVIVGTSYAVSVVYNGSVLAPFTRAKTVVCQAD